MSDFSVSVVIPLFNKAPFIRRTLESVLAQTLAPAEIILVDDGSTDGSVAAIADLIGGRVRLLSHANAGPGPTRNRGAAEASSEWIALIDGDDLWLPPHLENFADLHAAVPSADVLVNGHYRLAHGSWPETRLEPEQSEKRAWDFFASRGGVNSSCVAVRRSVYLENQGFGSFCPGEDTDFWFRLALNHQYAKSERKTAIYCAHTNGLMDGYDRTRATYELPDLYLTIDQAIGDPRYRKLQSKIIHYRDCVLLRSIRMALYKGDRLQARNFIRLLSAEASKKSGALRALAWLPGPLVRTAAVTRTRILSVVPSSRSW